MATTMLAASVVCAALQLKSLLETVVFHLLSVRGRRNEAHLFLSLRPIFPFKIKKALRRRKRRYWVNPGRTDRWWENMLAGRCVREDWNKNFRMSREHFFKLVDELRPYITPDPRSARPGLTAEKKVSSFFTHWGLPCLSNLFFLKMRILSFGLTTIYQPYVNGKFEILS